MGDRAVTGSHADAPRKAPWGVGGSWVQGGWSPSETRGGGQLGAGAGARQSDSPLGRGSSLWLVALQITLFFRK